MTKHYYSKLKKTITHNYKYLIILINIIYSCFLLLFIYNNISNIQKSKSNFSNKQKNVINVSLYNDIIANKNKKQSPKYTENLDNPFVTLE